MDLNWQDLSAIGLVAIAAGYILRRIWLIVTHKKAGGCGSCSSCESKASSAVQSRPFVSIEALSQPVNQGRGQTRK